MAAAPTLRILLLGSPVVLINDEPLQIQRRLMRWMLFYLACQKGMVGRADLILMFWPDEAEEDARRHLRETLSKLRAQLPDPEMIQTEQDRVGLIPEKVYSDVLDFESLEAQTARACAQTPASTPLTQAVHQKVRQAVRLWRSARFLAGTSLPASENLNNWLLSTSQQLEIQRQRLIERLVDHDLASGDVESAIQGLRSALQGDETNESLHFHLLTLLKRQGRYSEALSYCTFLQELFRREGYSELPPALLSLSHKISEDAAQPAAEGERSAWPSLADMQVPFVGQQKLLQELQFAVRRGGPVILFGEAGAGKSRFVRELFFSLKPAPRLLLAPARMMENNLPLQPVIDMLRHDIQAEEWKRMDPTWVTPLTLLLPELPILRPEIHPPQVEPGQEHSLIFESLRQLLLFLGKKQRFLLFLDNAQWSDSATLAALAYLAERGLFGDNGALILAARMEEPASNLDRFLNRPRSSFSVQRTVLPRLDVDEVGALARYVLGDAYEPTILPRLERETGGNPLFVLETLRLVLDYSFNAPLNPSLDRLPLANSVLMLVRERLQHLSPDDAQVLSMAAVIAAAPGGEFSTDLLESTCMLPPEQIAQTLESLAQSNLIRAALEDRPSSGYTFVQEKIREVILLDLSPARKRLLHLRIARALEQKPAGQSVEMEAVIASHFEEAGELNSAFLHWLESALYAWQLYRKEEAIGALQNAEKILQRLEHQASDVQIYQLYRQWGRLAYDIGDAGMLEQVYRQLLQFGQHRQNPLLAGSAYSGLAQSAELRMQPTLGLEHLDKARRYLEQVGRLFEHIEIANRQGIFMVQLTEYGEAQKAFQEGLRLGEKAYDDQSIEARAMTEYCLSILLDVSGWPSLALETAKRSYKDAEETFYRTGLVRALCTQATAEISLGRYQAGLEHALQGLKNSEMMQISFLVGDLHGIAASACLAMGNLDGCLGHTQQALQNVSAGAVEEHSFTFLEEAMHNLLGKMFSFLGAFQQAEQIYQRGNQTGIENFHVLDKQTQLGTIQALMGNSQAGLTAIERVIQYTAKKELVAILLRAQLAKASILIDANPACQEMLEQVLGEAQRRGLPEVQIQARLLQAQSALRRGNPEDAANFAEKGAEAASAIGHLPLEIELYALWLKAARPGNPDFQRTISDRLQERIQKLVPQAQNPAVSNLLEQKIKAWTESFENN